mmetsp:Transcript_8928/g.19654  ORF Transcript_8928/g.19654 Transcript_8928/m.19654 type:complete len:201 (+) Transcript_8928:137-739(+)
MFTSIEQHKFWNDVYGSTKFCEFSKSIKSALGIIIPEDGTRLHASLPNGYIFQNKGQAPFNTARRVTGISLYQANICLIVGKQGCLCSCDIKDAPGRHISFVGGAAHFQFQLSEVCLRIGAEAQGTVARHAFSGTRLHPGPPLGEKQLLEQDLVGVINADVAHVQGEAPQLCRGLVNAGEDLCLRQKEGAPTAPAVDERK